MSTESLNIITVSKLYDIYPLLKDFKMMASKDSSNIQSDETLGKVKKDKSFQNEQIISTVDIHAPTSIIATVVGWLFFRWLAKQKTTKEICTC